MSDARTRLADEGAGARRLISALIGGLDPDDVESDEAIEHGLRFGADAFTRGTSLHHMMKALDLLFAMTLYAVESAFEHDTISGSAATGIRIARQLQRRSALLSLAATRGYTQSYADALRERFRHLRHDLRNPLGTIKSVLSLMNDESVPLEARADPRFQAMAKRNARSLEDLIADRLSDAAALLPVVAGQDVSLRSIACTVRRELRGDTERHGVTMLVGANAPYGRLDAPGLELLLRGVLQAVLHECQEGDQLHLDFDDSIADRAIVIVSCESGRRPLVDEGALARLSSLALQIGASLSAGEQLLVSVPMGVRDEGDPLEPHDTERERPIPRDGLDARDARDARDASDARESAGREPRDDIGSARQRHHGETGAH
ncbi:MAG: hypothetical protein ABIP93_10830 [Gemmatimonadaceae bacterium]